MSAEAIEHVMQELKALPESDQHLVLGFLAKLRQNRNAKTISPAIATTNPALTVMDGLLVFTGEVDGSAEDWVEWERDLRDKELVDLINAGQSMHP
jgi:hypothetical protein